MRLHAQEANGTRTGCVEMCLGGGRCNRRRCGFALWSWACCLRGTTIMDRQHMPALGLCRQVARGPTGRMPVYACSLADLW